MRRLIVLIAALFIGGLPVASGQNDNFNSQFRRGDTNDDRQLNIGDAVFLLSVLFPPPGGGPTLVCDDAADINDDGQLNIADAVALLAFLFPASGTAPTDLAAPFTYWGADPTPDSLGCKTVAGAPMTIPVENVIGGGTGLVTTNTTLTNDRTWVLDGITTVVEGVVLTIEDGTTIIGLAVPSDIGSNASVLVTEAGTGMAPSGQLVANGLASGPVVFTSQFAPGFRGKGDWGGLVLLGRGKTNSPSELEAEGLVSQFFGGSNDMDSSGSLQYVRVEFGGFELSPNNEVNSITFGACGANTTMSHVQVKRNLDDGFEWFGGSMDSKNLIASYIRDDDFDYSFGYCGKGQFWASLKSDVNGDQGFEVDGNENTFSNQPTTNPLIANVTLKGSYYEADGTADPTSSDIGNLQRRGAGGRVYNWLIEGWEEGLQLDDAETCGNIVTTTAGQAPDGASGNGVLINDWGIMSRVGTVEDINCQVTPVIGTDWTNIFVANNVTNDSTESLLLDGEFTGTGAPNLTVKDDAALGALIPGFTAALDPAASLDAFFDPAPYYGAIDPNGTNWTTELWVNWIFE